MRICIDKVSKIQNKGQEVPKTASAQSANAPVTGNNIDMPENASRVPAISVTQQEAIDLGNTSLLDANIDQLTNILEDEEQNKSVPSQAGLSGDDPART